MNIRSYFFTRIRVHLNEEMKIDKELSVWNFDFQWKHLLASSTVIIAFVLDWVVKISCWSLRTPESYQSIGSVNGLRMYEKIRQPEKFPTVFKKLCRLAVQILLSVPFISFQCTMNMMYSKVSISIFKVLIMLQFISWINKNKCYLVNFKISLTT